MLLDVAKSDTVADLKKKIKAKTGIPVKEQNLVYKGDVLDDPEDTLDDLGVSHGGTLLVAFVRGCDRIPCLQDLLNDNLIVLRIFALPFFPCRHC